MLRKTKIHSSSQRGKSYQVKKGTTKKDNNWIIIIINSQVSHPLWSAGSRAASLPVADNISIGSGSGTAGPPQSGDLVISVPF